MKRTLKIAKFRRWHSPWIEILLPQHTARKVFAIVADVAIQFFITHIRIYLRNDSDIGETKKLNFSSGRV